MERLLRFAISAALAVFSASASADSFTIPARGAYIIDGDTIAHGGKSYRFHGIDAPEEAQTAICNGKEVRIGWLSAGALDTLIGNRKITCEILDVDRYGRQIVRCKDRNGKDINEAMVRSGYAFAYRQYSTDYVSAEDAAKSEGAGLWQFNPEMPWKWRREH